MYTYIYIYIITHTCMSMRSQIPDFAWKRRLDDTEVDYRDHRVSTPSVLEIPALLPLAYKLYKYVNVERRQGRDPVFDFKNNMQPEKWGPHAAVPLG